MFGSNKFFVKQNACLKKFGQKDKWFEEILCQNKFGSRQIFGKKNCGSKKILVKKIGSKMNFVQKYFGSKKVLGPIIFVPKIFWVRKFWVEKLLVKKIQVKNNFRAEIQE